MSWARRIPSELRKLLTSCHYVLNNTVTAPSILGSFLCRRETVDELDELLVHDVSPQKDWNVETILDLPLEISVVLLRLKGRVGVHRREHALGWWVLKNHRSTVSFRLRRV